MGDFLTKGLRVEPPGNLADQTKGNDKDEKELQEDSKIEGFLPSTPRVCYLDQFNDLLTLSLQVLLSVTGGAKNFLITSAKLEKVFNRGLIKAAQNIDAWIGMRGSNN